MRNSFRKAAMWTLLGSTCLQTSAYALESCYLASDSTDELILLVDRTDGTSAVVVGSFGVPNIEAMAAQPGTGILFAANANQLGTINTDTGAFTATTNTFGVALAANGDLLADVTLSDVDSIGFDLSTGLLYGIQNRGGDDVLFQINTTTGALVPGAFGGDDYLLVSGIGSVDDIAIDSLGVMYASGAANLYSIPFAGASGTVAAVLVGPFGVGITDMEGLSTDLPGMIVGSTGASNTNGAFNNSVWNITTSGAGAGSATGQIPIAIGGDYEGFTCFLQEVDVELEKSVVLTDDADGSGTITPGDEVTYTITVTNTDSLVASGIEVTDNIFGLAGVSFVSFTTTKPNPGPPFPNPEYDSATGVWTVGNIPANTSYDLDLVYSIDAGVAAGTSIFNTAEVSQAATADPDSDPNNDDGDQSEDDEDNAVFVVGGAPPGPVSCPAGTTLVNLATPRNADASAAGTSAGITREAEAYGPIEPLGTDIDGTTETAALLRSAQPTLVLDLTDTIPENAMIILSIARNNDPGNYDIDSSTNVAGPFGGLINFAAGPNDLSQQINYFAPAGGARYLRFDRNTGSMWVDGVQYSQICESTPTADLTITKDDSSLTYTPGGTGTYVLTITNNGPDDVTTAAIADNLPNGVTLSALWTCTATAGSSCSAANGGVVGGNAVSLTADIVNGGIITVNVPVNFSSNMGDY